jgi:multiple sugar transport system substrate-binding protein
VNNVTSRRQALLAVLSGASLAACAPPGRDEPAKLPVTKERVEWWVPATGAIKPTVDRLVDMANASGRQLEVAVTPQAVGIAEESRAKFTTAVAAGTPPDLIYLDRYLVRSFGALGMIVPVDGFMKRSQTVKPADLWPYLIKDVTWKDQLWGVPFNTDVRAFYWHKASFADSGLDVNAPPATWEALEAAADRVLRRNADGSLARAGFVPVWGNPPSFYAFFVYLWQAGGEFLTPDENRPAFHGPEGLRALEWMVRQVARVGGMRALAPLTTGFEGGPGRDVLSVGRVGMQLGTSSVKQIYEENVPDVALGVGALPIPSSGGRSMNYAGGFALSIPAAARQAEAAWRLSEYLTTKEAQLVWAWERAGIPVLRALATSQEYQQGDAARKIFVDELNRGAKWVPTIPGTVDVLNAFGKEFTAAINEEKSPRDALTAAVPAVQAVLDENKPYR